jgi:hypothetical protein
LPSFNRDHLLVPRSLLLLAVAVAVVAGCREVRGTLGRLVVAVVVAVAADGIKAPSRVVGHRSSRAK